MRAVIVIFFALLSLSASEPIGPLDLLPQAAVRGRGVLLADIVTNKTGLPLPPVVLTAPPAVGRPMFFTRLQVADLLKKAAPELACDTWGGAERIRVARAARTIDETTIKELLTSELQEQNVKTRGQLELRLTRPWNPLLAPDEVLTLKILELPTSGVSPNFICRFEMFAGEESIGTFQQPLQAKIFKDVYVARSTVIRGQPLRDADIALESRDILTARDFVTELPLNDPYVEFRENVLAGNLISPRQLRLRAIVKRGKLVEAMLRDEALTISVKAEALEDGVPGQNIRLRNLRSKREIRGKVLDEQTVTVIF